MPEIGEISAIHESPEEISVEWRIEKYSELDERTATNYYSPDFCHGEWHLLIHPNGNHRDIRTHISIFERWCYIKAFSYTLSLKNVNGKQEYLYKGTRDVDKSVTGMYSFPQRSELMSRKAELLPLDILTVQCTLSGVTFRDVIGELIVTRNTGDEISIEWKIKNYSTLGNDSIARYRSPEFFFSHLNFFLHLEGNICLLINSSTGYENISLSCASNLKAANKKQEYFVYQEKKPIDSAFRLSFPSVSELMSRKKELLPSDVLTIQCTFFDVSDPNEVGYISVMHDTQEEISLAWKIINYSDLSVERNGCFYSPIFAFSDSYWYLQINPNFVRNTHLSIWKENGCERSVHYTLGLTNLLGTEEYGSEGEHHFLAYGSRGCEAFPPRSELMRRKSELLPSDVLTVQCTLRLRKLRNHPELKKDVTGNHRGVLTLSDNLKDLFLSGENCDVIIKVRERKYPVHSNILCARSPVFTAMFKHDMKERNDRVVDIPDCDPGAFRDFLLYLYAGKLDEIPEDNVFHLFEISNKYNIEDLKEECADLILEKLSVETVCEALTLATMHDHSKLLKGAVEYFVGNTAAILPTVKWQIYHRDNPTESNELFIKAYSSVSQKL